MNTFSIYDFKRFYCEETKTLQMTHSPVGFDDNMYIGNTT